MKIFIGISFLIILALPNSLFAEKQYLTSRFIDLTDFPKPDISEEESVEDRETTTENTNEEKGFCLTSCYYRDVFGAF